MKKICSICNQERDVEQDFSWRNKARRIRQTKCKYCQSKANKVHYQNNKQAYLERSHNRNERILAENQQKLREYLNTHSCVDCGNTDMRVLEFDHVYGQKSDTIAKMVRSSYSWSAIEAEIAKCEVRCANCHRLKTGERGGHWRFGFTPASSGSAFSFELEDS